MEGCVFEDRDSHVESETVLKVFCDQHSQELVNLVNKLRMVFVETFARPPKPPKIIPRNENRFSMF